VNSLLLPYGMASTYYGDEIAHCIKFNHSSWADGQNLSEWFSSLSYAPGKQLFIFDGRVEGFISESFFNQIYQMINDSKILCQSKFIYITSALNGQAVHKAYCEAHDISNPIYVLVIPEWEMIFKMSKIPSSSQHRPICKKFICLNRNPRLHRVLMAAAVLEDKELFNATYLSFLANDGVYGESIDENINYLISEYPGLHITINAANGLEATTPITLMGETYVQPTFNMYDSPVNQYYQQSLFNITTETNFFDSIEFGLPTMLLSEKTFKPFTYCQIPLLMGGPQTIAYLRKSGYDVFDDLVDHGYDAEFDHSKRFNSLMAEIKRINSSYTIEDCTRLANELHPRFINNYIMLSRKTSKVLDYFRNQVGDTLNIWNI
jgi:hypothetical protein